MSEHDGLTINKMNNKGYVIFASVLMIWGLFMSFLIPIWQIPDENTHLRLIGQSVKNDNLFSCLYEDCELDFGRVAFHAEEQIDVSTWKKAMTKAPAYTFDEVAPRGIDISIIKRLPATLGVLLGLVLRLPTFWVMQLGELFALIFYTVISTLALKLMPVKKELFAMLMLIPMALQQAASISPDAVLIPVINLFIAYIFYLRFDKKSVKIVDLVFAILLCMIITYIKLPYVFFVFLILMIPLQKIEIRIRDKQLSVKTLRIGLTVFVCLVAVMSVAVVYYFKDNVFVQVVYGFLTETKQAVWLLYNTVRTWGKSLLISSIGNFGWLDTPVATWFMILSFAILIALAVLDSAESVRTGNKIAARDRIVCWMTFFILVFFTMLSMVNHTITITLYGYETETAGYNIHEALYLIPYIGGLQGRYFLPFFPLFFSVLPTAKDIGRNKRKCILLFTICVSVIYVSLILAKRYYA